MEGSSYEVWKDIKGYEGLYQINTNGNIRSLSHTVCCWNGYKVVTKIHPGKLLTPQVDIDGYKHIRLSKNGIMRSFLVHRLVAETFISNPRNFSEINHKDENPGNNTSSNLEWCSHIYNSNYGTRNIRISKTMAVKKRKPVRCIETGIEYLSLLDAQSKTKINSSQIGACCNKKPHFITAGGYHWEYVEVI